MAYNFQFSGDPVSIAAAAKAHQAQAAADAQLGAARAAAQGQVLTAREQADGMRRAKLYEQPANFASVLGQLYDSSGRNSANMLAAYTSPYAQASNGYMSGLAGLGNSAGMMGAGAMQGLGATGQQLAANLGQIGTAQANSLASQSNAAANAYGQLGMGHYNLQGQLGTAMAQAAAAEAAAGPQYARLAMLGQVLPSVLSSLNGGSGGGFSASGPEGPIASGTFSGGARSWSGASPSKFSMEGVIPRQNEGGGSAAVAKFMNSQLDRMRDPNSDNNRILDGLAAQLNSNRDATMTSGREAIGAGSPLLSQVGNQIGGAFKQGLGALGGLAGQMGAGFNRFADDTGNAYRGAQDTLSGQFDRTFQGVNDMWDRSLGKNAEFLTPAEQAQQRFDEQDAIRNRNDWLYATQNDPTSTSRRWATAEDAVRKAKQADDLARWNRDFQPLTRQEFRNRVRDGAPISGGQYAKTLASWRNK